ncbi:DUF305 domain-containing protein [Pontibacter actiniarum]|uniref:DUF305 domain-containing protein n=1 Tax=Pontibacter actiniarum TaxID=323450 RepID=A0A1X9YYV8_9BACT|nr:DUF305 domain-containing protein [Pontibacter actiniarum]ARS38126.1 hypothetical protein CA264_21505 [Pontibacter actiniarum]
MKKSKNCTLLLESKFKISLFFFAVLFFLTSCNQSSTNAGDEAETSSATTATETTDNHSQHNMNTGEMSGMMEHMHQNMEEMHGMKATMTGDPDYDFAQIMSMHHQGAIRMAEDEIANGTNAKMKEMAQKTVKTNKEDIQKLQDFAKRHQPAKGDTATTMRMMQPMNKMMDDVHRNMGDMSGANTDHSFAQMMIHHHEIGNEMARAFLKQGKTPEMKQMAQKTIDQQTKEISELEAWKKQNPK